MNQNSVVAGFRSREMMNFNQLSKERFYWYLYTTET